ncbi:unnamed protein product [Pylaiella littoralis]
MAEALRVLSLLQQETAIVDEVLGALTRCQRQDRRCPEIGTKLDAHARAAIRKALELLRGKEAKLVKAGEALSAHQQLHAEVESLRQEVAAGEQRVQDCARRLTEANVVLKGPLEDARRLLEAGRNAEAAEIGVSDIVDYAQRISGITSAPSYWKPGMSMVGFAPPAPRPEMMRAGALSAFAVTTGTTLSASELLRIANVLDKPPDQKNASNGTKGAGVAGSDDNSNSSSSNSSSPSGEARQRREQKDRLGGEGESAKATGVRRAGGGGEDGGGGGSPGGGKGKSRAAPGASFAKPSPPKRPKISLDLDDLDSDIDDEDDDDGSSSGGE